MTRLERRYRSLLRLLPRWYRLQREEEMVATFLADRTDDLDPEYGWPGWTEAWAVAALAVRTRLATDTGPARPAALGGAVRLVALLGLLAYSSLAVASIAGSVAYVLRPPNVPRFGPDSAWIRVQDVLLIPVGASAAIVAAFVLLLTGRRTAAKAFAVVTLLPDLVFAITDPPPTAALWLWEVTIDWLPQLVVVGCLFAGFHREAPLPAARPWLRAAAAGAVLATGWNWIEITGHVPGNQRLTWLFVYEPMLLSVALVVGGLMYLAVLRPRGHDPTGAWAIALAACVALQLPVPVRLLGLSVTTETGESLHGILVPLGAMQLTGLVAVGLGLVGMGIASYRRLSAPMLPIQLGPPRRATRHDRP